MRRFVSTAPRSCERLQVVQVAQSELWARSQRREDVPLELADGVGAMPFAPPAAHLFDELRCDRPESVLRLENLPQLCGFALAGRIAARADCKPCLIALRSCCLERDLGVTRASNFSFPAKGYFNRQSFDAFEFTSRRRPFSSKSLKGFSRGLTFLMVKSSKGLAAHPSRSREGSS